MKEHFQHWLQQNALTGNLLACAMRFPDRTAAVQSRFDAFPDDKLIEAIRNASDLFQTLQLNRLDYGRIRWIYQNALFHCERRQDGIVFGIFTSRDLTVEDVTELERLFEEFKHVQVVSTH